MNKRALITALYIHLSKRMFIRALLRSSSFENRGQESDEQAAGECGRLEDDINPALSIGCKAQRRSGCTHHFERQETECRHLKLCQSTPDAPRGMRGQACQDPYQMQRLRQSSSSCCRDDAALEGARSTDCATVAATLHLQHTATHQ